MRNLIAGVGLAPGELKIDLGEFHPSAQGGFQLHLTLEADKITHVEPRIGFMHRGAEKLFEVRDYRQIMMLANRHDWYAPFTSELGVALTLEAAMGIHPPERATWIRMLLAPSSLGYQR
jgi:NADH-quinone oxidoreductase subunit D